MKLDQIFVVKFWYGNHSLHIEFFEKAQAERFYDDIIKHCDNATLKEESTLRQFAKAKDTEIKINMDGIVLHKVDSCSCPSGNEVVNQIIDKLKKLSDTKPFHI